MVACASIIKNYAEHEMITASLAYSIQNMEMVRNIAKFLPHESDVSQDTSGYLHALHVDYEDDGTPTLYDIPSCNLMELRGDFTDYKLSNAKFNQLLTRAVEDVDKHSMLALLRKDYDSFCKQHPRRFLRNFVGFLNDLFSDEEKLERIQAIIDSVGPDTDDDEDEANYDYEALKLILQEDFVELKTMFPMKEEYEVT